MHRKRTIFLDRDGTVIEDVGYLADPDGVRLVPGAGPALRRLRADGFRLALVSNQSGIGRGLMAPQQAEAVHAKLIDVLTAEGVTLDDVRYCPHEPDAGCSCRKPLPGLLLESAGALGIDLASSVMVGDTAADVGAGRAAGVWTIAFGPNSSELHADDTATDWPAAEERIRAWAAAAV